MKHILLVFTGGTIGSSVQGDSIRTDAAAKFRLLELYKMRNEAVDVDFRIIQPMQILSENLQPLLWQQLVRAIEKQNPSQFDGIIVMHGTDTLAFTAAALALYFNRLAVPLLLVSSNYPLQHPAANGLDNFTCAVDFIVQKIADGVFVPYRNPGQAQVVHVGSRLAASLQLGGDFYSVQSQIFMRYEQGRFERVMPLPAQESRGVRLKSDFSRRVLLLRPYPGLDYRHIDVHGVDAVLHDLYHSGTACTQTDESRQHSLLEFCRYCSKHQVPLYLAPALKTPDCYETTQRLMAAGAEMIWNMSLEAAYVKLLLAFGNFEQRQAITEFLLQDIAWEHV